MNDRRSLEDIVDTVFGMINNRDWNGLNDFVYHSSYTDRLDIECVLRSSFAFRSKLKDWNRSVDRYYKFLNRNQYNADAILKGLIND